jgi:hypothetical protein
MTTNKLTETLDDLSDKAFGFKDKSPEQKTKVHEKAPVAHDEDRTETLNTSDAPTAVYPVAAAPTEHTVAEPVQEHRGEQHLPEADYPAAGPSAIRSESYPQPPVNPPSQHLHTQDRNKPELKTGPEQDFTVATVSGFVGVLSLMLMFSNAALGLLAIIFGATAVYFARRTERAGIGAGIGKTLGWFSFFGGVLAVFAAAFFLFVAFVYVMIR